jgi:N6-adenosine-specific RNA methylase IME4
MSDMALPRVDGGYGVIYADPPWRFTTFSAKGRGRSPDGILTRAGQRENNAERHYATMSLAEIKALPVGDIAGRNSVLLLWAIDPMLPEAIETGRAWGFTFKTVGFYWPKTRKASSRRGDDVRDADRKRFPMGTGYWTRANPEQCLLFTRGKPKRLNADVSRLVISPRREHSRKPDEVRRRIERLVAGPYLEMFGRQEVPGWDVWGNQVGRFDRGEQDLGPMAENEGQFSLDLFA